MKEIISVTKRFLLDEKGTEIVEWAIVGGLVVAVGAAIFLTVGTDARTALSKMGSTVTQASG